jgi:hypothetical protein
MEPVIEEKKKLTAQELRIGNYYYNQNGTLKGIPTTVGRIEEPNDLNFAGLMLPIPLTEDWLLRMGCERNKILQLIPTWYLEIGRGRRLSVTIEPGNTYIWLQAYELDNPKVCTDLVCLFNSDYDGQLYVHTFQNITHALTSSGLTIKE